MLERCQPDKLINADKITEEEWLKWRKMGLGGSDIAAILGLSPWASPLTIYEDKTGGVILEDDDVFDNCAMEVGKELEDYLARKFQKWLCAHEGHNVTIERDPWIYQHPMVPWALGSLDGVFTHPEKGRTGLELKTTNEFRKNDWEDDDLPEGYYIQVQWYMFVAGLEHFYIAYLIGNRKFGAKYIPRNDDVIRVLFEEAEEFWQKYVQTRTPPEPIGLPKETDLLKELHGEEEPGKVVELHDMEETRNRYKEVMAEIKGLESEKRKLQQQFMAAMGDAELAWIGDKKVTWKTQHRKGYTVEPSSSRVMRIG